MKKSLLAPTLLLISFLALSQVRIIKVIPSTNTITVKNYGASDVDISGYRLCSLIKYTSNLTSGITINSGDMNLSAGEEVEFVAPGGASSSWQDLKVNSDLGIFLPSGSFGSAANMVDFVQWGSGGNGRESVANSKGIWTSGDFVAGDEPFTYTGDGSQNGASFWIGVVTNVAPTDINLSINSIAENNAIDDQIGSLTTTDSDESDSHTYSLVSGTGDTHNTSFVLSNDILIAKESFNFEIQNSYAVRIETNDGNGGTFSKSFTITITDAVEAPTDLFLSSQTISENNEIGDVVGNLSTEDEDLNETYTYELVSGAGDTDNASFQIVGNELQANEAYNFEAKSIYSIRVLTNDGNQNTFDKSYTITILDLNDSPTTILLSNATIAENQPSETEVGLLSTEDEDADSHTYSLVSGDGDDDNGSFSIMNSQLLTNGSFNFEIQSNLKIRIEVQDQNGGTLSTSFEISITDVTESPTDIMLSNATISENEPIGTSIGILSTIDDDNGETYTYTFVSGTGDTDNTSFQLNSGNEIESSQVFDAEQKSEYSIRLSTNDGNGNQFEKSFSIFVTGQNDQPTDITLSTATLAENQSIGFEIGQLTTADGDIGDSHTYTLIQGDGAVDNSSFTLMGDKLKSSESFNFENKSSYSIRIQTTDVIGSSFSKAFPLTITNVSESPTGLLLDNQSITENNGTGTVIGSLSTIDEDLNETYTYKLIEGDGSTGNSSFQIVDAKLQAAVIFDAETNSEFSIRLSTTDGDDNVFEKSFTITINDQNEAPTALSLSTNSISENEAIGFTIGTLTTADQDTGDTHTYSLVSGSGDTNNGSFTIDENELIVNEIFNFESKASYSLRIETADSQGATLSTVFTISIIDLNEAPTAIELSASVVCFGDIPGYEIGLFTTTDEDLIEAFTYTLQEGNGDDDNELFSISKNKLILNTEITNDFPMNLSILVRSADLRGLAKDQQFSILVSGDPILGVSITEQIKIYPNPFVRDLQIDLGAPVNDIKISITDLSGKKWVNQTISTSDGIIAIRNMNIPPGFYLLRVLSSEAVILERKIFSATN